MTSLSEPIAAAILFGIPVVLAIAAILNSARYAFPAPSPAAGDEVSASPAATGSVMA